MGPASLRRCVGSVLNLTRHVLGDLDQVVHDRGGRGLDLVHRHQAVGDLAPEVGLVGPGGPETTGGGAGVGTCVLVSHLILSFLDVIDLGNEPVPSSQRSGSSRTRTVPTQPHLIADTTPFRAHSTSVGKLTTNPRLFATNHQLAVEGGQVIDESPGAEA